MAIILASKSPRRRELLQTMGLEHFEVRPASGPETLPAAGASPAETVKAICAGKAAEAARTAAPDDIVIAADTLVFLDGKPLGKLITVFRGNPGDIDAALAHIDGEHVRAGVLHHAE